VERVSRRVVPRLRRHAGTLVVVLCGVAALGTLGCRSPAPSPPNVLLILIDTLRADHLGAYGYTRPTSPTFDALAARGVLFTRAHSTTSWTNPAIESLFTGQHPRVLQPGAAEFIAPNSRTLAQAFRESGYRTAAIIANPVLPPDLGFAQGFDSYAPVSGWVYGLSKRPKEPAEHVNAAALQWLQQSSDTRPWFLYLHYMDPHYPYEAPADVLRRFWRSEGVDPSTALQPLNAIVRARRSPPSPTQIPQIVDLYDAAVAHVDAQVGELLSRLQADGRLTNTIVCLMADHGEELGDHGGLQHARTLYEEVLRIPLLIVPPAGHASERIERLVQITGVGRTLLDLAGLGDRDFPGRALAGGRAAAADGAVFAELLPGFLLGTQHHYALLRDATKLVVTADGESLLFDLAADPAERQSVAAAAPERVAELKQQLAQAAQPEPAPALRTPDAATRERLRALGYEN